MGALRNPVGRRQDAIGFDHVLVPLDGSQLSLAALSTAGELAARFGAELHTITVAKRHDRARRLRSTAAGMAGADGQTAVVTGSDPASAIVRHADELGSCLVCMSTRARGRIAGAALGSVATAVTRQGGPIVVVGPLAERPGWFPPPPRWPAPLSTSRIVACLDGSVASEAVLQPAFDWAQSLGMSLTIVTIVSDADGRIRRPQGRRPYGSRESAIDYIGDLVAHWRAAGGDVDGHVLSDPIGPASAIRHYLAARPAGLVAVSTAGRSGLRRLAHGAMAATIVRASVAPCLVVPQ